MSEHVMIHDGRLKLLKLDNPDSCYTHAVVIDDKTRLPVRKSDVGRTWRSAREWCARNPASEG